LGSSSFKEGVSAWWGEWTARQDGRVKSLGEPTPNTRALGGRGVLKGGWGSGFYAGRRILGWEESFQGSTKGKRT